MNYETYQRWFSDLTKNRRAQHLISTKEKGAPLNGAPFGGAEEGLNEPFVRLLMLVRSVNEENVLKKGELDFEGV